MSLLMTVIAGHYTAAYNSNNIGVTEDGFRISMTFEKEKLIGDAYGNSVVDAVYRGANVNLALIGMEYTKAGLSINPYGQSTIDNWGLMGLVGRLDVGSGIASAMILTSVAGTTAEAEPASLTASNAIPDEGRNTEIHLAAKARKIPLLFQLLPYFTSGGTSVPGWFTMT